MLADTLFCFQFDKGFGEKLHLKGFSILAKLLEKEKIFVAVEVFS